MRPTVDPIVMSATHAAWSAAYAAWAGVLINAIVLVAVYVLTSNDARQSQARRNRATIAGLKQAMELVVSIFVAVKTQSPDEQIFTGYIKDQLESVKLLTISLPKDIDNSKIALLYQRVVLHVAQVQYLTARVTAQPSWVEARVWLKAVEAVQPENESLLAALSEVEAEN